MKNETESGFYKHQCPQCTIRGLCVRAGLDEEQINRIGDEYTHEHPPYRKGERIFSAGKNANRSLYVVKSGAVKTEMVMQNGFVRVTGFYLTGEMFGFDTLGADEQYADAIALTRSWICELPADRLESLCSSSPAFQSQVLRRMGRELHNHSNESVISRYLPAEKKVARFLSGLLRRLQLQNTGKDSGLLQLPMLKADIASYLGLDPATLSRILTVFENSGMIRLDRRRTIEVLDMSLLT